MKRTVFVVTLLSVFLLLYTATAFSVSGAENSWSIKASMLNARAGAGAAAVNGMVYVTGGSQRYNVTDNGFSYMSINSTEAYNPATDAWTLKAHMPTARDGFGAAAYQNKIYCFGGRTVLGTKSNVTNVNEVYDTETDTWQTLTAMPTARYGIQASEVDGKLYIIGGYESAKVEIYDPLTDTWATGSPMPTAVGGYASAVLAGKIYVISGSVGESAMTNLTQIYDPKTDKWSFGAPIPMSVSAAAAGATTGTKAAKAIYVIGGANAAMPLDGQYTVQAYFPETNSWVRAAPMPADRAGLATTVIDDTIYVMGGGHNIFTMDSTTVMQYVPFISPAIQMESPPIIPVTVVSIAVIVVFAVCILIYLKKRKR